LDGLDDDPPEERVLQHPYLRNLDDDKANGRVHAILPNDWT
jgi:hypothetical protein